MSSDRRSLAIDMAATITSTDMPRDGRPDLERQDSHETMTMEHFLESAKIDRETARLMIKYDRDGNGQFDFGEVAAIVLDLKSKHRENAALSLTNTTFKRLLCAMCVASVFILLAMVGVSYSVAVLLQKTDIDATGALVVAGTHQVVATDARAELHVLEVNDVGLLCVGRDEVEIWRNEVTVGRNVLLQTTGLDGTTALTRLSGVGVEEAGHDVCFSNRSGGKTCWVKHVECNTAASEWFLGAIFDYDHDGNRRNRH